MTVTVMVMRDVVIIVLVVVEMVVVGMMMMKDRGRKFKRDHGDILALENDPPAQPLQGYRTLLSPQATKLCCCRGSLMQP